MGVGDLRSVSPRRARAFRALATLVAAFALSPFALQLACGSDDSGGGGGAAAGAPGVPLADAGGGASGGGDGAPCTRTQSTCNPDCQASCGASASCVELCCPTTTSTGVLCNGVCSAPGTRKCGDACVDLETSTQNCGACGNDCGKCSGCASGKCGGGVAAVNCTVACGMTGPPVLCECPKACCCSGGVSCTDKGC